MPRVVPIRESILGQHTLLVQIFLINIKVVGNVASKEHIATIIRKRAQRDSESILGTVWTNVRSICFLTLEVILQVTVKDPFTSSPIVSANSEI